MMDDWWLSYAYKNSYIEYGIITMCSATVVGREKT